jgi:PhnB protein
MCSRRFWRTHNDGSKGRNEIIQQEVTMAGKVNAIPDGYHSVTPYLIIKGAAAAIEFYKKAFGATEIMRMPQPDGRIGHAEIQIGNSRVMLADEFPERGIQGPAGGRSPVMLHLYVEDVDKVASQALAAGAKEMRPVQDQFYGYRSGMITDPFGHSWNISTHKEDLSREEMQKRMKAEMAKGATG